MPLVAGVDCSTQATKVVVVDADGGAVVASGSAAHEVTGTRGARETHPAVWERALAAALRDTGRAGEIAAISVAGQQHGLVVVDGNGRPLRPAVLWNDTRSAGEATALVAALGGPQGSVRRTGSVLTASFTVTTWAWLRRAEPSVAAAARGIRLPHDHLTAGLTGEASTDRSDASGTGWWNPASEAYDPDVLALGLVDLDPRLLPRVLEATDTAGMVTPVARDAYGLRPSVVVACGAGDNAAAALAMALRPGEAGVSLGTSGTVFAIADRPAADPTGTVAGFASANGHFLPLACTLNATLAIDRIAGWLGLDREDVAPSDGVVCLPWLDGERTPDEPTATGTMGGLRHTTSREAVLQAAYEGAVATVLEATGALDRWAPQDLDAPLVLLGGGARGATWRRTVGRLSGRPLLVSRCSEPVAYGAAVQAGALLRNMPVDRLAAEWDARAGEMVPAVPRDDTVLGQIAAWRETVLDRPS